MEPSIKAIFDKHCADLKIDIQLLRRIRNYGQAFVNRDDEHIAFFGGNLLGVHQIRFKNTDRTEWYDDIMNIDDVAVRDEIVSLPHIDPDWVRGTDVMNLSCIYLSHRIMISNLSDRDKHQGMIDTLMVFYYKLITSLVVHYFRFPADESSALATYAALTKKSSLKRYGSWTKMFIARCEDIVSKNSLHYKTLKDFAPDDRIQYMITDVQGRLRNQIKKIWKVYAEVLKEDNRILSSRLTSINQEGEKVMRDLTRNFSSYRNYILSVASDPSLFIKDELVAIINSAMHTMQPKPFTDTLQYMCKNFRKDPDIEDLINETILNASEFIASEGSDFIRTNDLGELIRRLRANYMSSRSTSKSLLHMRVTAERIVKKATPKTKSPGAIASVRNGVLLYLVIRCFTMKHYG